MELDRNSESHGLWSLLQSSQSLNGQNLITTHTYAFTTWATAPQ